MYTVGNTDWLRLPDSCHRRNAVNDVRKGGVPAPWAITAVATRTAPEMVRRWFSGARWGARGGGGHSGAEGAAARLLPLPSRLARYSMAPPTLARRRPGNIGQLTYGRHPPGGLCRQSGRIAAGMIVLCGRQRRQGHLTQPTA